MTKDLKIIENCVDPILFFSIKDTINGDTFYWFYNDYVNYRPCKGFKFYTEIIKNDNLQNNFINYLNMIKPILSVLSYKKLYSVSAQLLTQTINFEKYSITQHKKDAKIGILFANTCDGGIEIDNNFIEAEENKLILFNSNTEYKVITPTKDKIFTYILVNYD